MAADAQAWIAVALSVARKYQSRHDIEDIRSIALLAGWKSVLRVREAGEDWETQAAFKGAQWAVAEYIRQQPGGTRYREVDTISLEALTEEDEPGWEPTSPDFTPGLIDRLALWEAARAALTEKQYEVVERKYRFGQEEGELARDLGITVSAVNDRNHKAKQKLAEALGEFNAR